MTRTPAPEVDLVRLADRPDLAGAMWALGDLWPRFMVEDPIGDLYYSRLDANPDHVLLAVTADDRVLARAFGVRFALGEDVGRPELPDDGWDGVIRWAWLDDLAGRTATHLSALEILVAEEARGTGLAGRMLEALRATARAAGLRGYVAPVRPSRKQHEPEVPMSEYAARTRDDGLPQDPWLRLHVRAGGRIVKVCSTAMTITGTIAQWRAWTGLPFDAAGPVVVPGALAPVHADPVHDHAVYVEANVWVEHHLGG
jgi:GNAT superfamily N-acetyltransferase